MDKIIQMVNIRDVKLLYMINSKIKCDVLDRIVPYITNLGGALCTILTCFILILFGKDEIKLAGYRSLSALATSHIIIHMVKKNFTRLRPFKKLDNINIFDANLNDYSFPSGHTAAAFSLSVTLSLMMSQLTLILIPMALLIGFSRIYLGVHYPTDVFVGMIIGTTFSIFNHLAINAIFL